MLHVGGLKCSLCHTMVSRWQAPHRATCTRICNGVSRRMRVVRRTELVRKQGNDILEPARRLNVLAVNTILLVNSRGSSWLSRCFGSWRLGDGTAYMVLR